MNRVVLVGIWILIVLCLPLAMLRMAYCILTDPDKAFLIAKGFDRTGSALTNGTDREYISSRAYESMQNGKAWGCILCRLLDFLQKDHCKNSMNSPQG
jgi:hypothetical protein